MDEAWARRPGQEREGDRAAPGRGAGEPAHEGHGEGHAHEHGAMAQRGVTRHEHAHHAHMDEHGRREMRSEHHAKTLWVWWTVLALGAWMLASPLTFDYGRAVAEVAGGRWLPWSDSARVWGMTWSDILSGVALVILGWRMLTPGRPVERWLACGVGVWLTFAPMVFWAPSAAAYLNSTTVGAAVIALTILIPGMPGMIMIMKTGPEVPPGWSYNPSSWPQRSIMIALAFAGWLVSRYLAAYQMGYSGRVWEPFFGAGSRRVLESDMSAMWPVSDAALGAAAYTFEFLMGWMGGVSRWRTMPWMVLFFAILIVPLGLVHIALVISQPVVVGEWCTLCLLAAAIMLPMIPLTLDEVTAMGLFMADRVKKGERFWDVFWFGGTTEGGGKDERSPAMQDLPRRPGAVAGASVWGVTVPWTLAVGAALGLWMMVAPAVFGTEGAAADSAHLTGALILVVAVVAMAEVARALRLLNALAGLWLVIGAWTLDGASTAAAVTATVAGLVVAGLSLPRGRIAERYGRWERWIV